MDSSTNPESTSRSMAAFSHKRNKLEAIKPFFDDLSEELLFEILIRLPIKPVHRCKCVSKHWCSLISSPYFSSQYTLRRSKYSPSGQFILFYRKDRYKPHILQTPNTELLQHSGFSFTFLPTQSEPYIVASCNGLVLCATSYEDPRLYYLCNPLTKKWAALPPPRRHHRETNIYVGFICDTKVREFTSTTKYKLLRIPEFTGFMKQFKVEIFCFDTWEWCELEVSCNRSFSASFFFTGAICCNGMLYWFNVVDGVVIAYDPYNSIGECMLIDLPTCVNDMSYVWTQVYFGMSKGLLRLSHIMMGSPRMLNIWELINYKTGEWRLAHRFCLSDLVKDHCLRNSMVSGHSPRFSVQAFNPIDGDIVYMKFGGRILSCNMKNKTWDFNCPIKALQSDSNVISEPFVLPWWPTPVPKPHTKTPNE